MNDNPKPESFKPDAVGDKLDTLKAENKALKEQLSTALKSLAVAESQTVQTAAADRQQPQTELASTREELAKLKGNPPPATQQPPIDLPEQIGEIVNFLKKLLPQDTKWPKRVIPSLREFLESKED